MFDVFLKFVLRGDMFFDIFLTCFDHVCTKSVASDMGLALVRLCRVNDVGV